VSNQSLRSEDYSSYDCACILNGTGLRGIEAYRISGDFENLVGQQLKTQTESDSRAIWIF